MHEIAGPSVRATAARLNTCYGTLNADDVLRRAVRELFPNRIALVSSFGAEAAVLLHLLAELAPATPVLFLETGKHFPETLAYRDELASRLGLTNVVDVRPDADEMAAEDPGGTLSAASPRACCALRKVRSLERALAPYDAWITGRRREHTFSRRSIPVFEAERGRIKVNPLASWDAGDVDGHLEENGLPRHPLVAQGYLSIGCAPCTEPVGEGEDPRAGRWRGSDKTECGIHFMTDGAGHPQRLVRRAA